MRKVPAILILLAFFEAFFGGLFLPVNVLAAEPSALASLSDAEQSYYFQVFDYSMNVVKPGQKYDWATYSGKGSIAVSQSFISKSGSTCRNFTETYTVLGQNGADKGVACKRVGKDGWCRLKPDNALTCSMEDPSMMFSAPTISTPTFSGPNGGGANVNTNVRAPDVQTNVNVDTDVNGPNTNGASVKGVAHSVTSTMGQAAGSAVSNSISLFGQFFR